MRDRDEPQLETPSKLDDCLCRPTGDTERSGGTKRPVWDQQRALVSGARVTATEERTGLSAIGLTATPGIFLFPHLLAGSYTVRIEAQGFAAYEGRDILVFAAQTSELTAILSLGSATTEVSVYAGADMAHTESSQISGTFEGRSISDIPIVGGTNYSVLNLRFSCPTRPRRPGARRDPAARSAVSAADKTASA
jgi:hypothetical protein